ncbi:MAG: DMT family transporter [Bacteroidetes bacterium]|nr:DMT family transporter [Bacteroidota bacterium]MBS1648897.1 DMT family transporter [Bacteroidota bacterium]
MKFIKWILFIVLSVIWGSSFILMKEGMNVLSPYQVAALRIFSAGLVLLPFFIKAWKQIPKNKIAIVLLSGLVGNFIPAFLFCLAETKIDSSIAGILNALTPLFTIIIGMLFFNIYANTKKIIGVFIGFIGLILLFTGGDKIDFSNISYSLLILLATLMYGINVNMVGKYLQEIGSLNIATVAFGLLVIPSLIILFYTGYFQFQFTHKGFLLSTGASCLLGIMGTAIATVLFYRLLKTAGALFASMVTYGIPIVAVLLGLLRNEKVTVQILVSLFVILLGVYIVNIANKNPSLFKNKKG